MSRLPNPDRSSRSGRLRRTAGETILLAAGMVVWLALPGVARAQTMAPRADTVEPAGARRAAASARALRLGGAAPIRVDGLLSDSVWRGAPVSTGLKQQEPAEGMPASDDTEIRVVYDSATLYIGVLA